MINKISFKTKIGWISAFAKEDKIFRIQFGKIKFKNDKNKVLNNFKKNSLKFYLNKIKKIEAKCKIESSIIQKKVWSELRKIKSGHT